MSHILVVDDEEKIRFFLKRVLSRAGHSVSEAEDGLQALHIISEDRPDLVLLDIIMPNKEGIETIMEIRHRYAGLPIIAMSGGGSVGIDICLELAQRPGADATLEKPFPSDALVKAVYGFTASDGNRSASTGTSL